MAKLTIGDYVEASPVHDRYAFVGETFRIVGFTRNLFGQPLVQVVNIKPPNNPTVFYPHELWFENGERPTT